MAKTTKKANTVSPLKWRAIAFELARHIRNVESVPPLAWGVQGGELLMRVRDLDPKSYAENVSIRLHKEPGEKADTISLENVQKMWDRMGAGAWEAYRASGCACEVNSVGGYPNILRYSTVCPLPAHAKAAEPCDAPEERAETEEEAKERVRQEQAGTTTSPPSTSGHWG